ncbi:FMN-binding protein [Mycetocola zhadangensis]|uniref:FMN-binding protein n=1 Tax=Mycetocola zhadangensis TaxID=1164595 RepID=UPI003A4DE1E9
MQIRTRQNAGAALAGLAVIGGLAGCSAPAEQSPSPESEEIAPMDTAAGEYTDGEYTATGDYQSPGGPESVTVTLTLADNVVTALDVTGSGSTPNARRFQGEFIDNIADVVVGKPIDDLSVSKVAGSSLTSGGFNNALDQIKDDADAD